MPQHPDAGRVELTDWATTGSAIRGCAVAEGSAHKKSVTGTATAKRQITKYKLQGSFNFQSSNFSPRNSACWRVRIIALGYFEIPCDL